MQPDELLKRLEGEPFKPFRIHLDDGSVVPIKQPEMLKVGLFEVVVITKFGRSPKGYKIAENWRIIGLSHVTELSELPARRNGRRRAR